MFGLRQISLTYISKVYSFVWSRIGSLSTVKVNSSLFLVHPGRTPGASRWKTDSAIHWINHSLPDSTIGFPNTYPLESYFSGG